MINLHELRDIIFQTVGFEYDGYIETFLCDGLCVKYDGVKAQIGYSSISTLCRGYFLFAKNFDCGMIDISEKPHFDMCGCMLDASRNGVMKVEAIKKYMNHMAALGLNMFMLYTEDTYELEDYPYFGYMRGRYTQCELREIDEYGKKLGIEVIGCIQTLAHLSEFLQYSNDFSDTDDILLVGNDKTYEFIEAEIVAMKNSLSSKRIHIGMDEAHDIGRGKYLDINGYEEPYKILNSHLQKVVEICKKHGLTPMMWNDMYFRLSQPNRAVYYDYEHTDFSQEMLNDIPDVDMVYWDYCHVDKKDCVGMIKKAYELKPKVIFAGGISIWYGHLPAGDYTVRCTKAALEACLETGTREAFATMWGDDGTETNAFFSIPYLALYSEYCYKGLACTDHDIWSTAEFLTKIPHCVTEAMGDFIFFDENDVMISGKELFYADIMYDLGIDVNRCKMLKEKHEQALDVINSHISFAGENVDIYNYARLLFKISIQKAQLRIDLRNAYHKNDTEYLSYVASIVLPQLKRDYINLKAIHKKQWNSIYKPFGFEVLSFRYGGIISRINDVCDTINDFLDGKVKEIPELNEKLLPLNSRTKVNRVITPSVIY